MRDEGVIYVAGHPLLNRRYTRLPGCICLRNDLYCVEWGVKLYSLTHSLLVILATLVYSDNFVKIDVYFGQSKSEKVLQNEAYDVISFFSK